jgi:hypothetical protein
MDYIILYLLGFVIVSGLFAWRTPHTEALPVFIIAVFWPLSILFGLAIYLLDLAKINFNTKKNDKMFGIRTAKNPKAKGFGVTMLYLELQFWKMR